MCFFSSLHLSSSLDFFFNVCQTKNNLISHHIHCFEALVSISQVLLIPGQGNITIDNNTDPIVVQEGQKFDILFSLHEVPLPYRIIILHRATNSNVPHLTCVLFVSRDNYTTSDSETCRPLTQEASRHVYKLTKTFSLHESGELIFQVMTKQQNIIVKRGY